VGAKNKGEIVTAALIGTLGEVKTTEAASGVGLLLEPGSGKDWAEINGPCLAESPTLLSGNLAAEVTPVKTLAKTGKLVFVGKDGSQDITEIVVKGVKSKPRLELESRNISWDATETLMFSGHEVEIT
jgi:hypothetical protein